MEKSITQKGHTTKKSTKIHDDILGYVEPWVVAEAITRGIIVIRGSGSYKVSALCLKETLTMDHGKPVKSYVPMVDELKAFKAELESGKLKPGTKVQKLIKKEGDLF